MNKKKKYVREGGICQFFDQWSENGKINYEKLNRAIFHSDNIENNERLTKKDMMTLEEAIQHCKEKSCDNSECSLEHKQLGEWLKELQYYRNIWKNPSQLPEKGKVVVACCNKWEDVICGEFKILELNIDDDTKTYRIDYLGWEYVVKWAYLKDVFPYRDFSDLNLPVQFKETRRKGCSSSNGELASHQAWEESLLIADRIRGY